MGIEISASGGVDDEEARQISIEEAAAISGITLSIGATSDLFVSVNNFNY